MVCKEEVIGWFKDLSGFKRIDFMCGLLNMCVPFELRFFGTCVEDLGKKDFHYLREAEHRANSTADIAKLTDLNDDVTRSKLIVSLALLDASNHVCSNVIFKILTDAGKVAHLAATSAAPASGLAPTTTSTTCPAPVVDQKIGEEIFLLFTMALHHPAFTFDQKSSLGEQLKMVKASFKAAAICEDQVLEVKCKDDSLDSMDSKSSTTSCAQSFSSGGGVAAVRTTIKHLEMKRFQKRKPEKKSEFKIQVTWSNGDVTDVSKTYQELYEFSLKVQQLLPDDKRSHRQDRNFPVLPALRHIAGHRQTDESNEDGSGKLSDLVHQFLCRMPPLLLDCDPVTWFFHGQSSHSPQWSSAANTPPSNRSNQGTMLASPRGGVHLGAGAGSRVSPDESLSDGGRVKSLTIYNSQIERSGKISQEANKGKLPSSGSPTSCKEVSSTLLTNSIVTHQVPCSSPVSSPQASPVSSPFASPSQSGTSSRAASPWVQRSVASNDGPPMDAASLNQLFKQERAKRCRGKLTNCSVDEHRALTEDDLVKQGFTPTIINQIKVLENNRNPPNGLNLHSMLERMSVSNPTTPSSAAPTVTSGGLSFSTSHTDACNPLPAQLYPSETVGRHSTYPVMPHPPSVGALTHVTNCNTMSTVTGMSGAPTLIPCNTPHHPGQQPHRPIATQFHSSQPSMHCQVQPLRRAASAESSPSCSQNSSPPESPSLDSRNHYDSSCSEETDKDKEVEKSKFPDLGRVQKTCSLKTKGIESGTLSNPVPSKGRCEDESHYLMPSVGMISTPRPEVVNTVMPMRPMVLPDLTSVTVSLPVASVPMNSAAAFQRTRLNTASTPSPPGSVVHSFKSGPQHIPMASPVRNSNNTIIIENSQFVKTLSSGAATVPAAAPSAHSRWEGMNGSCPSTMNGSNAQPPPPNNPALFIFTTAQIVTQAENVAACRTCTTCVSSPSMVVTCASRHPPPQVTSVNMSSVVRSHNNKLTSPHLGDDTLKVNNNSLNSSMPPTTACLPCVGQAEPPSHPIPSYPPPPISYPSMPPSPVAPTTVTYTTPAFVPANSGPLANSQTANAISQGQVSHNPHGGMPPVSTGCSNTCACSCSGAPPSGNLPYSPSFLHLQMNQMSSAVFTGFPGFLQPHNTNGFISPTLPNFPFAGGHLAGAIPNGITPELIYSGTQFPMLQQQQNGSHHSTAPTNPGFLPGPAPNLGYHSSYTNPSSQTLLKGKNVSCYNCGVVGHRGIDCKEATMEEITKPGQFRLNYAPSSKPMESTE